MNLVYICNAKGDLLSGALVFVLETIMLMKANLDCYNCVSTLIRTDYNTVVQWKNIRL